MQDNRTFSAILISAVLILLTPQAIRADRNTGATCAAGVPAPAVPLSAMSSAEIVSLLAAVRSVAAAPAAMPVDVTADDLMTKVYGVLGPRMARKDVADAAETVLSLRPTGDARALWLDSADGYGVRYAGMTPEVSALARFENDSISDFGFFFLFPYGADDRQRAIDEQTAFCGSLLQEIHDLGADMGADSLTDDIFNACGSYGDGFVDVRLIDDADTGRNAGRYILVLSVEPRAFTTADNDAAL